MARRPTQQQLLDELLTRYDQEIADAFRAAITDIKSRADLRRLIEALSRNDIPGAIDALHLDPAAFNALIDATQAGYNAGGSAATDYLPPLTDANGAAMVIRFNGRNYRAEQYLRENSAGLVTRIVEEQRTVVRAALEDGMRRGDNPRTVALDIVGRVDRATGQRQGGVIGLTAPQEQYVRNARAELTSGDPASLRDYLERARRDKRYDRSIQKAIRDEQPLPADVARKALIAYERRLLQLRGQMIGRTEALRSLNAGAYEALQQAVESGAITASQVRRTWRSAGDLRVRHTHMALNGDSVGLDERFRSPSGAFLRFPGDPQAPASETINCRCVVTTRIDFLANL